MKQKILGAAVLSAALSAFLTINCQAITISEYHSDPGLVSVYVDDVKGGELTAKIGGEDAEAKNVRKVTESERIETVFLVDASGSMGNYETIIKDFIRGCVKNKEENEYFYFAKFGSTFTPTYLIEDENDRYELDEQIDRFSFTDKASYIYDNLKAAVEKLENDRNICYKRIVIFTDGVENSKEGITSKEVEMVLANRSVQLYTVTFVNSKNVEQIKNVATLARMTGGEDIQLDGKADGTVSADTIRKKLGSVYQLELEPNEKMCDGGIRPVIIAEGAENVVLDMRMPTSSEPIQEETETVTTKKSDTDSDDDADTGSDSDSEEDKSEEEETEETTAVTTAASGGIFSDSKLLIVYILIGVAVLGIALAVIVMIISRRKAMQYYNDDQDEPEDFGSSETVEIGGATEILSSNYAAPSDATEILYVDNNSTTVILSDVQNRGRIFESVLRRGDEMIVGRDASKCNKVIDYDKSVSGRHCRIYLDSGDRVMVEDMRSSNHTFLNDKEIFEPQQIQSGDELRLGRVKLEVSIRK